MKKKDMLKRLRELEFKCYSKGITMLEADEALWLKRRLEAKKKA